MHLWDYKIDKNWKPQTERQWLWYLERKINYDDWNGLKKVWIKKYFPQLQRRLDPGKYQMLKSYLENHGRA